MVKTKRYRVVNGRRVFWKYDALQIDPRGTRIAALAAVDTSDIERALGEIDRVTERLEGTDERYLAPGVELHEYHRALAMVRAAKKAYAQAVAKHCGANPVYFEPRHLEEIITDG